MPAAAVIPAPIAYIKVVAVKKLVVGFLVGFDCVVGVFVWVWFFIGLHLFSCIRGACRPAFLFPRCAPCTFLCGGGCVGGFYFEKIRVFKAGGIFTCLNRLAWNNGRGLLGLYLVGRGVSGVFQHALGRAPQV